MGLHASLGVSHLTHRSDFVPIERGSNVAALTQSVSNCGKKRKGELAGHPLLIAYARFVGWAIEQAQFPTPERVMTRFGISRATAYRWLTALAEAYGVDKPRRDGRVTE
jgi:DNA-binding transcriptional ArsR family regulator